MDCGSEVIPGLLRLKSEIAAADVLSKLRRLAEAVKYDPNQPRVPAGNPDGGQWTRIGWGDDAADTQLTPSNNFEGDWLSENNEGEEGLNDPRVLSDAEPDDAWILGEQYAQSRGSRTPRSLVLINGQRVEPTPAQAARLAAAETQAQNAITRVQEVEPNWRPRPSSYESVEGLIRAREGETQEALARLREFRLNGAMPGSFAGDSIPARGPGYNFTSSERRAINMIGWETGCHTCGTTVPGTSSRNFIPDHQPPTAWNFLNRAQRLFPHCASCSSSQGFWIGRRTKGK